MGEHGWPGAASLWESPETEETRDFRELWDSAAVDADSAIDVGYTAAMEAELKRSHALRPLYGSPKPPARRTRDRFTLVVPCCIDGSQRHPVTRVTRTVQQGGVLCLMRRCDACGNEFVAEVREVFD